MLGSRLPFVLDVCMCRDEFYFIFIVFSHHSFTSSIFFFRWKFYRLMAAFFFFHQVLPRTCLGICLFIDRSISKFNISRAASQFLSFLFFGFSYFFRCHSTCTTVTFRLKENVNLYFHYTHFDSYPCSSSLTPLYHHFIQCII